MDKETRNQLITVNATAVPAAMLLTFLAQNSAAAAAVLGPVYAASVAAADYLLTRKNSDPAKLLQKTAKRTPYETDAAEFIRLYDGIRSRGAILESCGVPFFENFYREILHSAEAQLVSLTSFIKSAGEKDELNTRYIDRLAGETELVAERAEKLADAYLEYLKDPDTDLDEVNLNIRSELVSYRANRENAVPLSDDEIRRSVQGALQAGNYERTYRIVNDYRERYQGRLDAFAFETAIVENIPDYVRLHSKEFILDPGDGTESPYLKLCRDPGMTALLVSLGAPRGEKYYENTSFAFHSDNGVAFALSEDFIISAFNTLNGIVKTDKDVFLNFLKGKYYRENTAVMILDILNINGFNRKNLYEDLCKKLAKHNRRERNRVERTGIPDVYRSRITGNGWDLKYIFESIGYHFEYEGPEDPFAGPGVYYIL